MDLSTLEMLLKAEASKLAEKEVKEAIIEAIQENRWSALLEWEVADTSGKTVPFRKILEKIMNQLIHRRAVDYESKVQTEFFNRVKNHKPCKCQPNT